MKLPNNQWILFKDFRISYKNILNCMNQLKCHIKHSGLIIWHLHAFNAMYTVWVSKEVGDCLSTANQCYMNYIFLLKFSSEIHEKKTRETLQWILLSIVKLLTVSTCCSSSTLWSSSSPALFIEYPCTI